MLCAFFHRCALAMRRQPFSAQKNINKSNRGEKNDLGQHRLYIRKELETLGLVKGSTIQSRHIGKDIGSSFRTLVGGEMKAYTEMMESARTIATNRMVEQARSMGADAVINIVTVRLR
jgi:uncharacterized protein YbjQ (UPF0145 family)